MLQEVERESACCEFVKFMLIKVDFRVPLIRLILGMMKFVKINC